jgi:hypothetical protein
MNAVEALGIAIGAVRAQSLRVEHVMESPRGTHHQHARYLEQLRRFDACLETLDASRQTMRDAVRVPHD